MEFPEIEFNMTAAGLALLIGAIAAYFLLGDPANTGMNNIPLATRIIAVIIGTIGVYFVSMIQLNRG